MFLITQEPGAKLGSFLFSAILLAGKTMRYKPDDWYPIIQEMVSDFQNHLKINYDPQVLKRFTDSLNNNAEAAVSEAVIFNWLCENSLQPRIKDDVSSGGADFICVSGESEFVVEVTCLGQENLAEATKVSLYPVSGQPMIIIPPAKMVKSIIKKKVKQLARKDYKIPRVVIITTFHSGAGMFLGIKDAENFLTSEPAFTFTLGGRDDGHYSTNLKNSLFIKRSNNNPNEIEFTRQSVSAVLLVTLGRGGLYICGILHPKPNYSLDIHAFPKVPFVRIKNDVIKDKEIFIEWVISQPDKHQTPLFNNIKSFD